MSHKNKPTRYSIVRYHAIKATLFAYLERKENMTFNDMKHRAEEIYEQRLQNYMEKKPHARPYNNMATPRKIWDDDPVVQILLLAENEFSNALPRLLQNIVSQFQEKAEIPVFRKIVLEYIRQYKAEHMAEASAEPQTKLIHVELPTYLDGKTKRIRFMFPDLRSWSSLFFHTGAVKVWSQLPNAVEPPSTEIPDIKGLDKVIREITETQLRSFIGNRK